MDYTNEPSNRHEALIINRLTPFNAEPPCHLLRQQFITPTPLFYVRTHGPTPDINERSHCIEIRGIGVDSRDLRVRSDLMMRFEKHVVVATLMCAGNRRTEMAKKAPIKGVPWYNGALSNATWAGARLKDVLIDCGLKSPKEIDYPNLHIEFVGDDVCVENKAAYATSIPLSMLNDDVLLAYEMNSERLTRDHGFPVRVIVPGVIGARSVKWLKRINIIDHESHNYFQQRDYKLFIPQVNWSNIGEWWDRSVPIQQMNVTSAICRPRDGDRISISDKKKPLMIEGYALSGGGRKVVRVDLSFDDGVTWVVASLKAVPNERRIGSSNGYYTWFFWSYELHEFSLPLSVVCRAWDSSSNTQPSDMESIWNLRGVMNNSWHRIRVYSDNKL